MEAYFRLKMMTGPDFEEEDRLIIEDVVETLDEIHVDNGGDEEDVKYFLDSDGSCVDPGNWSDLELDIKDLSIRYPQHFVVMEVEDMDSCGEEMFYAYYAFNGKCTSRGAIITYPPCEPGMFEPRPMYSGRSSIDKIELL